MKTEDMTILIDPIENDSIEPNLSMREAIYYLTFSDFKPKFIEEEIPKNKYCMFIRKVAPEFPNETIRHYIYDYNKEKDDSLIIRTPSLYIYNKFVIHLFLSFQYGLPIFILLYLFKYIFYKII